MIIKPINKKSVLTNISSFYFNVHFFILISFLLILNSFNSPLQNKLIKIYDWEKNYKLQPTRSLIKYMRAIAKESAKNTTSSRGHSDSSGDYTYLLSGCPKSSELDYDYPEFFAFRDLAFYFKYWYVQKLEKLKMK